MRELTKEQREIMRWINTPESKAEQASRQAAMEAARAESDRLWAISRAKYEQEQREAKEAVRPLKEALRAAGIKLEFNGYYEGAWMRYQIGSGPIVEVEEGLSAFEEED